MKVGTKHASKQVKVVAKWNALLLGKFRMSRLFIGNGCGGLRTIAITTTTNSRARKDINQRAIEPI